MFYVNLVKMKLFATSSTLHKSEPLPKDLKLTKFTVFVYFVDLKSQLTFEWYASIMQDKHHLACRSSPRPSWTFWSLGRRTTWREWLRLRLCIRPTPCSWCPYSRNRSKRQGQHRRSRCRRTVFWRPRIISWKVQVHCFCFFSGCSWWWRWRWWCIPRQQRWQPLQVDSWFSSYRCRQQTIHRPRVQWCLRLPSSWCSWRWACCRSTIWWTETQGSRWKENTSCQLWRWWCKDTPARPAEWSRVLPWSLPTE